MCRTSGGHLPENTKNDENYFFLLNFSHLKVGEAGLVEDEVKVFHAGRGDQVLQPSHSHLSKVDTLKIR